MDYQEGGGVVMSDVMLAMKCAEAEIRKADYQIARLEAENAELRKDKERLDFIQAFDFEGEYGWKMYRRGTLNCAQFTDCPEWHKSPREAIDAAMAETAGEEPSASLRGD